MFNLILLVALLQDKPFDSRAFEIALAQDKPDDKAATEALEKFKTAYKSKDVAARTAAVTELAKTDHEKVIAKLGALLMADEKDVRIAAAKGLGVVRENRVSTTKAASLLNKALPVDCAFDVSVVVAIVEALDKIQEGLGLAVLHQNCASPAIPIAKGAIEAAGELRQKPSIPYLIQLIKVMEAYARESTNVGPGGRTVTGGGLPGVGGGVVDPEAPKRAKTLTPVAIKALQSITRKDFKTVKEWDEWWKKEGTDFKVPGN